LHVARRSLLVFGWFHEISAKGEEESRRGIPLQFWGGKKEGGRRCLYLWKGEGSGAAF